MDSRLLREIVILACALGLAAWAGRLGWRIRRIPNWLTVPALLVGLTLSAVLWRWPGLKLSLRVNNARATSLDNPGLLKIPFGVAAALSTGLFFVVMSALRFFPKLG